MQETRHGWLFPLFWLAENCEPFGIKLLHKMVGGVSEHQAGGKGEFAVRDKQKEKTSGSFTALVLLVLILLPAMYFLSLGPVAYCYRHVSPWPDWTLVYMPLWWLSRSFAPFHDLLNWYISMWTDVRES
jgi:hypothetical protein